MGHVAFHDEAQTLQRGALLLGRLGAEVAAVIAEAGFESLDGPVTRVAAPDVPISPYAGVLEDYVLPNAEKITKAIRGLAAY